MKVLIVDDEFPNLEGLRLQLIKFCHDISDIQIASTASEAREKLALASFDILFLDINMPKENGFELLESLENRDFAVVFVTAYSEYAIRAFKANAVDYLLKPVDRDELIKAVEKCKFRLKPSWKLNELKTSIQSETWPDKITMQHQSGFHIILTDRIIWIEADGNYSTIHLIESKPILVTKAIREFEFILNPKHFFRCHKSALIHLKYVTAYESGDGHSAVMFNKDRVQISRRRLDDFRIAIETFSKRI